MPSIRWGQRGRSFKCAAKEGIAETRARHSTGDPISQRPPSHEELRLRWLVLGAVHAEPLPCGGARAAPARRRGSGSRCSPAGSDAIRSRCPLALGSRGRCAAGRWPRSPTARSSGGGCAPTAGCDSDPGGALLHSCSDSFALTAFGAAISGSPAGTDRRRLHRAHSGGGAFVLDPALLLRSPSRPLRW